MINKPLQRSITLGEANYFFSKQLVQTQQRMQELNDKEIIKELKKSLLQACEYGNVLFKENSELVRKGEKDKQEKDDLVIEKEILENELYQLKKANKEMYSKGYEQEKRINKLLDALNEKEQENLRFRADNNKLRLKSKDLKIKLFNLKNVKKSDKENSNFLKRRIVMTQVTKSKLIYEKRELNKKINLLKRKARMLENENHILKRKMKRRKSCVPQSTSTNDKEKNDNDNNHNTYSQDRKYSLDINNLMLLNKNNDIKNNDSGEISESPSRKYSLDSRTKRSCDSTRRYSFADDNNDYDLKNYKLSTSSKKDNNNGNKSNNKKKNKNINKKYAKKMLKKIKSMIKKQFVKKFKKEIKEKIEMIIRRCKEFEQERNEDKKFYLKIIQKYKSMIERKQNKILILEMSKEK